MTSSGTRQAQGQHQPHLPADSELAQPPFDAVRRAHTGKREPKAWPTAASYRRLGILFAAFTAYGSLSPFDFRAIPLTVAWAAFQARMSTLPDHVSRTDVLANVLLFTPLGFTWAAAALLHRTRSSWLAVLSIVVTSIGLSTILEFLQLFTLDRITSNVDIAAQTIGFAAGMLVWVAAGQRFHNWLSDTANAQADDRLWRVLVGAAAVWLFVNLMPFDFTLDLGELAERVRGGEITLVPFAASGLNSPQRVWDAIATVCGAAPLGVLGIVGLDAHRRRSLPRAIALGSAVVVLTEFAQVFLVSHAATATDALFGVLGVAVGAIVAARFVRPPAVAESEPLVDGTTRVWAIAALIAWFFVLCAYHWLPYDFVDDPALIRSKISSVSWIPFASYLQGSYINAANDALTKLCLAVPFGVFGALADRSRATRLAGTAARLFGFALAFSVVEAGQLFLPTRLADPTDVLTGVIGAYIGLRIGGWIKGASA